MLKPALDFLKNHKLTCIVFLIGFASMLFFTLGIDFFWEDVYFLNCEIQNVPGLITAFFKILFTDRQFFNVGYMDRPLGFFSWNVLSVFFGTNVMYYRVFSAFVFASIIALLFLFVKKSTNTLFGLAAVLSVLFIPDYWLAIVNAQDANKYTELFVVLAYFIFFYFYRKKDDLKSVTLYFILIILFLRISILLKHVGRLFLLILPLFLLITAPSLIKKKKYILLIIASLFISLPVLGLLKYGSSSITVKAFNGDKGIMALLLNFLGSYHTLLMVLGVASFVVLAFSIIIHLYTKIKMKRKSRQTNKSKELHDLVIFSFLWFFLSLILVYLARGFAYEPRDFQRYDTIYIICAFFIFLYSYVFYVTGFLKKKHRSFFRASFLAILMLGALFNLYSLNQWRGGWGDYFIAWQTTKDKIDGEYSNSLLIVPFTSSLPFVFLSTNKGIRETNLSDIEKIKFYSYNYSNVFIADRKPINFNNATNIEKYDEIKAQDNSLYGNLKKLLKRSGREIIYVYKYNKG